MFRWCWRIVSADKVPTLHLVAAVRVRLLHHVSPSPDDLEPVMELKAQLSTFVKTKFVEHRLHQIAALLDPRIKSNLDLMSADDRLRARGDLRQMVMDLEVPVTSDQGKNWLNYSTPQALPHLTYSLLKLLLLSLCIFECYLLPWMLLNNLWMLLVFASCSCCTLASVFRAILMYAHKLIIRVLIS